MGDFKYRLYCYFHRAAKILLKLDSLTSGNLLLMSSLKLGTKIDYAEDLWSRFIRKSVISAGNFYGMHYAGYIAESKEWCLSSWIWTNAAIVRHYCLDGDINKARTLAGNLSEFQQECGGWVVRNDYDKLGPIPMLAPNDSAYIANNAFLTLYEKTEDQMYLDTACRCADWIIDTARPDGMVYLGFNMRDHVWEKKCVIVDVGFTGGLFARLYEITNNDKYLLFLKKFINRYIDLFYKSSNNGFCTSVDKNNRQQGGMFGRGQAWALEGLIPAYKVLKDERIRNIIQSTINNLIRLQNLNGAWAYNLSKPLMGEDCKAVSLIAKNMMDWYFIVKDERIRICASKALDWCCKHTLIEGDAAGGIFSFCMEGAIVQKLYTSCAFVYSSVYAMELCKMLKQK